MLFLHAPNVHQGGGRSLLVALLRGLKEPVVAHFDVRLTPLPDLPDGSQCIPVHPSIRARFRAERELRKRLGARDHVLCFGNLPPVFVVPAKVSVYVQNIYLLDASELGELPLKTRLRLQVERLWLRWFLRDAEIIVQSETMAQKAQDALGVSATVLPFVEPLPEPALEGAPRFDFIYVASGEAHKNHLRLFQAWEHLAHEGITPKLAITFDPAPNTNEDQALKQARKAGALIEVVGANTPAGMADLYRSARSLVYPSLFESLGLPLLEAAQMGLPIVASERDYVRDIADPRETFDPLSSRSIARAVRRMEKCNLPLSRPAGASELLDHVLGR